VIAPVFLLPLFVARAGFYCSATGAGKVCTDLVHAPRPEHVTYTRQSGPQTVAGDAGLVHLQ